MPWGLPPTAWTRRSSRPATGPSSCRPATPIATRDRRPARELAERARGAGRLRLAGPAPRRRRRGWSPTAGPRRRTPWSTSCCGARVATVIGIDIGATKTLGVALGGDGASSRRCACPPSPGPRECCARPPASSRSWPARSGPTASVGVGVPASWPPGGARSRTPSTSASTGLARARPTGSARGRTRGPGRERRQRRGPRRRRAHRLRRPRLPRDRHGLAAGIVVDGRLRRGAAGSPGRSATSRSTRPACCCGCGQRGCLETVASGSALAARVAERRARPARSLLAAGVAGDAQRHRVWRPLRRRAGAGRHRARARRRPEVVVLGGGVAEVGEPLRSRWSRRSTRGPRRRRSWPRSTCPAGSGWCRRDRSPPSARRCSGLLPS